MINDYGRAGLEPASGRVWNPPLRGDGIKVKRYEEYIDDRC